MAELPRLNGVIRALEQGQAAIAAFTPPKSIPHSRSASPAMTRLYLKWSTIRGTREYCGIVFNTCLIGGRSQSRILLRPQLRL